MSLPTAKIPRVTVEVGGRKLDREDSLALHEVRVRDSLSLPRVCELRFLDAGGALGRGEALETGSEMKVWIGDLPDPIFSGDITAVQYIHEPSRGRELRLRAYDRLHRLRKRQPVRTHVEVTLKDLAAELLRQEEVTVEGDTGPLWPKLVQFRQTDFDLLAEVAVRSGLYFTLRGDRLRILTLQGFGESSELRLGKTLFEVHLELNGEPACRSVSSSGWDPWLVSLREGEADSARVGRRVEAESPPGNHKSPGHWQLMDEAVQSNEQANALAQAELDDRVAREVILRGVAEGDQNLRPGGIVEIRGVAPAFEGTHVLTKVTHIIDSNRGFVSEFSSEPPRLEHRPWSTMMTFGIVTRVDDPEGLGRIQVALPSYGNLESDWIGVVIPGAGPEKGLIALPDVDDRVLVLFAREDPAQSVVVGGLFGSREPPDSGVEGGARRRFSLLTPGKQKIRLDDGENSLRLENGDGSFLELKPGKVVLHSSADLEITAPGKNVVISGNAIDFKRVK